MSGQSPYSPYLDPRINQLWPWCNAPLTKARVLQDVILPNTDVRAIRVYLDDRFSVLYLAAMDGYPLAKSAAKKFRMDTLPIGGEVEPVGRARAPGLPLFQLFYLYPGVRYALSLRSTGELKWGFGDPHELVDFGTFHDPDHVCENIQRNMEADLRRILADARAGYPTAHKTSTLPNGQPIVMSTAPGFIPVVAQLYATAPIPFLSHSLIFEYAHAPTICYNYRRPSTLPLFGDDRMEYKKLGTKQWESASKQSTALIYEPGPWYM